MPVQTVRFLRRPIEFAERCRERYGDAFTIRLPGNPTVVISDPAAIKALFARDATNTVSSRRNSLLAPLLGRNSLVLLNGPTHRARRKLMLPPFHGERMRAHRKTMREATERELATWAPGETVRLHPAMQRITLDVIMRAVFGVSERRRDELQSLLLTTLNIVRSPLSFTYSLPGLRHLPNAGRARSAVARTNALLREEVAERRRDPDLGERGDVLSMLVAARDENGQPLSDRELRDQLVTLLVGGHETTATALTWAFDYLLHHRAVLDALGEELAQDGDEYLDAVIDETLRLRPVIPFIGRDVHDPADLAGLEVPAGTTVMPALYLAHTNPAHFDDPYAFKPERFLDGAESFGWVAFGGGTRRCLGSSFAQFELETVISTVLRSAALEPERPELEPIARSNVTLTPRHGVPVRVRPL